jgi:hypothetical protein
MLALLLIILGIVLAAKYNRIPVLLSYWFCCLCLLMLSASQGIEAAFQISGKPSDTRLYFEAFQTDFENISGYLFYHYPLFLKYLIFPFDNAYLALIGQCAALASVTLWVLRHSHNVFYLLVLLNHAIIYTATNFFKDNYLLILVLLTIGLLSRMQLRVGKSAIILICILVISQVRPFCMLFLPLVAMPYMFANDNTKVRWLFWGLGTAALGTILVSQWSTIAYIASSWSSEASVGTTGLSITSFPKVILGPTPFHYFYHDRHFVQPFLDAHGAVLMLLHFFYYIVLAYFLVLATKNIQKWRSVIFKCHAAIFSLAIGLGMLSVYMVAYGSADIRQRAVILSLIFNGFAILASKPDREWKYTIPSEQWVWPGGLCMIFYLVSVVAI